MYNVNTERINEILTYMDQEVLPSLFNMMEMSKEDFLKNSITRFAAERLFQMFIEGMTDIGNFLIDGFIMRDPGSYEDIVDIMEDEKVYTPAQAKVFKEVVLLRKALVSEYTVDIRPQLYHTFKQHQETMKEYPMIIREYLKKELW